jgi:hypothetical protein
MKYLKLVNKFQEGGPMAASPESQAPQGGEAPQQGGDPMEGAIQGLVQAVQAQDAAMALEAATMFVQILMESQGQAQGGQEGGAPQGAPAFKKGGKLGSKKPMGKGDDKGKDAKGKNKEKGKFPFKMKGGKVY